MSASLSPSLPPAQHRRAPALLWDVQEEHLNEAEFAFETWERALSSPLHTLSEVRDGPEERLMAHTMGLIVGGPTVLDRLVRPVLERELDDDRYRTAAAALALLDGAGREGPDIVLAHLPRARGEGFWGLVRALQISRRTDLDERMLAQLPELDGPALGGRLEALDGRGVDVGRRLLVWLKHEHPAIRRIAARLARRSSSSKVMRRLLPLMRQGDPWLRATAIESALIRGLPGSWELACEAAFAPRTPPPLRKPALAWVAMQGDAGVHARLIAALASRPDPDLLSAAGITGRPDAVAVAIGLLDHPGLGRIAGEVVSAVLGLSTRDERFWLDEGAHGSYGVDPDEALPSLAADDLDANLVPPELLRLRRPNARAIRQWWREAELEFSPALRYFGGRPLDLSTAISGLREAPMRRRQALALELAIRSAGAALLDCRASARTQITQLAAIFASVGPGLDQAGELDFQGGLPLM
ncbi:MAG: hypothetical protein R6X02_35120 [Enhygromyxa sp.]